jgi:ABC-2 type transport system ATP-binding protein
MIDDEHETEEFGESPMPTTAAIAFQGVTKRYPAPWPSGGPLEAVAGVSLSVDRGEVFGLLGPNRAGKTTLAKLLLSLCQPSAGRVLRLGRPASDRRTLARVGYVHERPTFPGHLTAPELLDFYGALSGVSPADRRSRIPELLDRVGLLDRSGEPISRFSKGMVQRLGLAQAMVNDPELLVLDEPTEGIDLVGRLMLDELMQDRSRPGRTVLVITHLPDLADRLCDRIAVLRSGRLAFVGPPADLRGGPDGSLASGLRRLYEEAA